MGFLADLLGKTEKNQAKKAERIQKQMMAKWEQLQVPTAEELALTLPEYQFGESQTAEQQRTFEAPGTAMEDIVSDPALRQSQIDTLQQFQAIADDPSLNDIDKASLYQILRDQQNSARGARDALQQNAAERRVAGSGLDLVSRMLANQQAAQTGAQQGVELAGQAEQRRRDALSQVGNIAGGIRRQDFGEAGDIARARDMISKFNVQQQTAAEAANIAAKNRIEADNIARRERETGINFEARSAEAARQADIPGMLYEMETGKLAGETGAATGAANAALARGKAASGGAASLIGGAGSLMQGAGALAAFSEREAKQNIEEISDGEAQDILGSLTGYKFEYKPEYQDKYGEGDQVGVMVNDLAKTEGGEKMISQGEDGRMVNYDPATITALLANIDKRLQKVEK